MSKQNLLTGKNLKSIWKKILEDTAHRLFEVFKENISSYKQVAREFCSHCLEINYLQLFGYEENLSEINLKH